MQVLANIESSKFLCWIQETQFGGLETVVFTFPNPYDRGLLSYFCIFNFPQFFDVFFVVVLKKKYYNVLCSI